MFDRHIKIIHFMILFLVTIVACEESHSVPEIDPVWEFELMASPDSAIGGSAFGISIQSLDLQDREQAIYDEINHGNLPGYLRQAIPVQITETIDDSLYLLTFYVMPDYLSVGNNDDYFLMPMTPILAQRIMDYMGAVFPTRKMVDLIWSAATVHLAPQPIAPSAAMITPIVFDQHNNMVQYYRQEVIEEHPQGELVSGHKKDVILSNRIAENQDKVVIYGWHYLSGNPIQPLYSGHANWYADYSHGIRPVLSICQVNDSIMSISDILSHPSLYLLLSNESGPMAITRYDTCSSNYP